MTVSPNQNQGIERTVALLKTITDHCDHGVKLADVAELTQLSRSTVHRLLSGLIQVGLVEQNSETLRYFPAFLLYRLGNKTAKRFGLLNSAQGSIARLAKETEDTVYLQIRSGDEALCIAREEGNYPIKTLTLAVGDRRPLGIGAGSLAILSSLPDLEIERVLKRNINQISSYGEKTIIHIEQDAKIAKKQGYTFNPGHYIKGMGAVGLPIIDQKDNLIGSLSIAAIETRMTDDRRPWLYELMKREAATIIDIMAESEQN